MAEEPIHAGLEKRLGPSVVEQVSRLKTVVDMVVDRTVETIVLMPAAVVVHIVVYHKMDRKVEQAEHCYMMGTMAELMGTPVLMGQMFAENKMAFAAGKGGLVADRTLEVVVVDKKSLLVVFGKKFETEVFDRKPEKVQQHSFEKLLVLVA